MLNIKKCCFYTTNISKNGRFLIFAIFSLFLLFNSCSIFSSKQKTQEEEITENKAAQEINVFKKGELNVEKSGGLFSAKKNNELGNNNVMWKATLLTLKDIPISVASYSGGIIQTDWYSNNSSESIKIKIQFTSNDIKISSFNVNSFKKICSNINNENRCEITQLSDDFNSKIKNKIVANIKKLKSQ